MGDQDGLVTRISMLRGLLEDDPARLKAHRERFALTYSRPLIEYLRRRWKVDDHEAEDLAQEFLMRKVLGLEGDSPLVRKYLEKKTQQNNLSFRAYLFMSLRNFFLRAKKSRQEESFDPQEAFDLEDPSAREELAEFDLHWAENVLSRAVEAVREDCLQTPGQSVIWEVFVARILTPALTGEPPVPYEDIYQRLGLETPKQAASRYQTAMRKFREALLRVVGDYLPGEGIQHLAEREREILELRQTIARLNGLEFLQKFAPAPQIDHDAHLAGSLFIVTDEVPVTWLDSDCRGLWEHLLSLQVKQLYLGAVDSTETLAEQLHGPKANRQILERLKLAGKEGGLLGGRTSQSPELDGLPQPLYVALYFAALASAQLHLRESISSESSKRLLDRLSRAQQFTWLDPATEQLFKKWKIDLEASL